MLPMAKLLKYAFGLAFILLLVACNGSVTPTPTAEPTPAPSPSPDPTGTTDAEEVLTILYWQAPSIPNPYLSGGYKDRDAGAVTLEPLAKYDPDGALVPALAAEIPTLENGGISSGPHFYYLEAEGQPQVVRRQRPHCP